MRRVIIAACAGVIALLPPGATPAGAQRGSQRPLGPAQLRRDAQQGRVPPGSYIRRPVLTVQELVDQIQNDPIVAERYGRLFHMSPAAVRAQFATMHRTTLAHDEIFRVYFVHGDTLGYKLRRVKAGTPVFALPNGTPVLVVVCGNPLQSTLLPPALALRIPDFNPEEEVLAPAPPILPEIAEAPYEAPSPFPIAPEVPVVAGPVTPGFVEEQEIVPPRLRPRPNLWPLLFLPLFGLIPGGGEHHEFLGPVPPPGPPTPTPFVPEPGACAMGAAAAIAALTLRRKRAPRPGRTPR